MRASEVLRQALTQLPLTGDLHAAVGQGGLLVLAPHPDDESLGCGGVIAAAAAAGRRVAVVVVSDGGASHPGSAEEPTAALIARRAAETRAAVAQLGLDPAAVTFLGLPDGAVPSAGPGFANALEQVLAGPVAAAAPVGAVLTTWRHDPHADHQASFALGAAVAKAVGARLLEYVVWGWAYAEPIAGFHLALSEPELCGPPAGVRFDIAAQLGAKARAVAAHASQHGRIVRDTPGFRLSPAALAIAARPFELLLEEAGP